MHIIVTGANGFIGKALVLKLLADNNPLFKVSPLSKLTLLDLNFDANDFDQDERITLIQGSFSDSALIEQAIATQKADMVFHLASAPSGLTESNHELGMQVNVHGIINFLDLLRKQENTPRFVFASSIAVYGKPTTPLVNDDTLPIPGLSYGFQKLIGENLIADYSRRGWINACSIRLPGIVTRPPEPNGAISIFFSDLIRSLSQGREYTCPVSAQARSWLMSVQCCVDNLLTAAQIDFNHADNSAYNHTWTLPALHCTIAEIVSAIAELTNNDEIESLITYEPDSWVEDNFGSYPPLSCPRAEAIGLKHDADLKSLVRDSM